MDLPPVNVTDEALVVAPRVDAMLLVVSEGKTQRSDLARALGVLSDLPGRRGHHQSLERLSRCEVRQLLHVNDVADAHLTAIAGRIPSTCGRSVTGHGVRPTVVVYTHSLLEPSMTFIVSHARRCIVIKPVYAGAHRVPGGLPLPDDRVVTVNRGGLSGRAEELLFRRFGLAGRAARDLRRFRPKLVHAHFGQSGPAALDAGRGARMPMVVTYHGQDATITTEEAARSWRGREYLRGRAARHAAGQPDHRRVRFHPRPPAR